MSQDHATIATPYIAVYLLFEQNGKIPLLLRQNTGWRDGYYGMPSGRVEQGESFTQAAIRECEEEVGVVIAADNLTSPTTIHLKGDDDTEWVALGFIVKNWHGDLQNAEPQVHATLEWFDPKKLPSNVAPTHRFVLQKMLQGESYAEYGWE